MKTFKRISTKGCLCIIKNNKKYNRYLRIILNYHNDSRGKWTKITVTICMDVCSECLLKYVMFKEFPIKLLLLILERSSGFVRLKSNRSWVWIKFSRDIVQKLTNWENVNFGDLKLQLDYLKQCLISTSNLFNKSNWKKKCYHLII